MKFMIFSIISSFCFHIFSRRHERFISGIDIRRQNEYNSKDSIYKAVSKRIGAEHMKVEVIRSKRKTAAIQIRQDLSVAVRVPVWISEREIENILREKEPWIRKHIEKIKAQKEKDTAEPALTEEQLRELADQAARCIPERVRYYAPEVGVDYGRITIRCQKTRWGSCSAKGNLNFNCLLMLAPPEVLDYVVVHELCHRKEMNHSRAFWAEVERVLPDYTERKKWLKDHSSVIMNRR